MIRCVLTAARHRRYLRLSAAFVSALTVTATFALPAFAQISARGQWGQVVPWPMMPIHMALLPDGKVMSFGATPQDGQGGFDFDIWDPTKGTGPDSHSTLPNIIDFNSFCVASILDSATGKLVLAGGNSNEKVARFGFKNAGAGLERAASMKYPRYYASLVTLPDGRMLVHGGSPAYGNQTNASAISEIYTPGQGWRELTGTADSPMRQGDQASTGNPFWYPHIYPIGNNEIFSIAGKYTYRINYSGNGSVSDVKPFNGTNYGATSSGLMYRPGLVMQIGGGSHGNNTNDGRAGSNVATIFDLRSRSNITTRDTRMAFKRHWPTSTVLPNGEVLVVGGSEGNNELQNVAYAAEIYNPDTDQWRTDTAMKVPRLYHSAVMLMKDGRVLAGGGGAPGPLVGRNAEIYTPGYLLDPSGNPAARPSITSGPSRVALGQTFRVTADKAIRRMTLVKTGAVTHGYNTDQRFFEASFAAVGGSAYDVVFPNDAINATPGLYMLFAFDAAGVPSIGKYVRLPSPIGDENYDAVADAPTSVAPDTTQPSTNNGGTSGTGGNGTASGGGTTTTPADGTAGTLIATHSNMCLSIEGGSGADGARAIQETCNGSAVQKWTWKAANGGSLLVNAKSNKCLDLYNFQANDGAALVQWGCWGGDNQIWKPTQSVNGGVALASKQTGKCVDVSAVSMQSGAQVHQWTCHGQANQSWKVQAASTVAGDATSGTQIGVEAAKVATAADGTTLVINRTSGVVWRYIADNNWTALGNRTMREVATGGSNRIFAIGTDGNAYRWNGTDWIMIGPNARTIAAASDGTVVVTNPANEIWLKAADDYNANWNRLGGTARKVVTIASGRFWSIGLDGNVYRSSGNGTWTQAGVAVSDIAASADGSVAVINKDNGQTWRKTTEDANWARSGGSAMQVSAQTSGLWITVGTNYGVYRVRAN